ncbi:tetratricopeptide repeat protein [Streptomyces sp. NBC_00006]|uniref:tetratricopeptide repeat protein n=1 Tax=Streptomyces sp. NBC_00006 TaxID=2975619 RepID=UPI002251771E|nr:tetratricopeptide repeat protein [Streptomyces sp. NBC_00006]MCX5536291.1 tetratricopeptide repeat protein [Streptomyces sp. NBC_00006]
MGIDGLRRQYDDNVRTLGEDHPRTLAACGELAHAYYRERSYVEAFGVQERLLAGVVRVVGVDDHVTVSTLANLASIWFAGWLADDRPEQAVPLYELAVAERRRVSGADDPGTLSARNDLATAYLTSGRAERAAADFEHTLADCLRVLGEGHALTGTVRANLDSLKALPTRRERDESGLTREIATAFTEVLGLRATVDGGRVSVEIPAIGETLGLPVCDVKRVTRSHTPMGDAALEFVMIDGDDVRPLIVLADDVVFAPEDPVRVLQSPIPVVISDAPWLISHAETVAAAERFATAAGEPGANLDTVSARGLLVRCEIAGALRFGLRSLKAVAWWQRGWEACADDWSLPPFPKDPVWDHLVRCGSGLTLESAVAAPDAQDREAERQLVAVLTVAEFRSLEPRLLVGRLDEEFVEIWKSLVPITPAMFTDLLLDRLTGAQAEVVLYPDGAGSVDLVLRGGGESRAVLQLRFDFRTKDITMDEVRIAADARGSGLFQRLQFNTERLAGALGLDAIRILATGAGSLAFAKAGFPRDRELYEKVNKPATGQGSGRA